MSLIAPNNPPFPAYRATDKECFAYDSTIRRWPIILDSVISDVEQTLVEETNEASQEEGRVILKAVRILKEEIAADKPLRLLNDSEDDVDTWNGHIQKYFPDVTWFTGTWLFNECYLYRRLRECISMTTHWRDYDPFERQKIQTFRGSHASVFELARKMSAMTYPMTEEQLEIIYDELVQVCLWGNATDLSLLTNMTEEDIKRLQAIEKEHMAAQKKLIVVDDIDVVWGKIKTLQNSRVDFILDNSGFEVFVDFVFADWLLQSKKASKVVFNCKTIPWFVSDVMPKDVPILFDCCFDRDFFPQKEERSEEDFVALKIMAQRWKDYIANGQLIIQAHSFWCNGLSYWYLKSEAPDLFEDLKKSNLVIFKGDLNFRKLVFDCEWPVTTSFRKAIGEDMAEKFTSIVTLRTNKADTIVGLKEGKQEEIEKVATPYEWRCTGKYAVVQYNEPQQKGQM
ncbi:uncharacterized protein BYT42DRAFT_494296 [Radiomyces spectabilis]|uniref:uncharacterized protein n=1 Tax=Radiomyces spectabilis TaxID=64574 RepID=UPI002220E51F|nr:uncharacterized protein BYT42DRAFT_494296 [Radiomyces spectabilis]KAI8381611.1 hypothetical protein BYT42DRAFT_494296 [Radiomyces spectabilis]